MRTRLGVLVVVAALIALLVVLDRPVPATTTPVAEAGGVLAGGADDLSSTWFCPIGGATVAAAADWQLLVLNPSPEPATLSVTALTEAVPASLPRAKPVAVPARTALALSAADVGLGGAGAVVVESNRGDTVVQQRLGAAEGSDAMTCASSAAASWAFPSLVTQRGNSARLWVMNPYAADASIDIEVSSQGIRVPAPYAGVVIPGRTVRSFELGEVVPRFDQFAVEVTTRAGLVVAGVAVVGSPPAPPGLRLELGRATLARRLVFADGPVGPGITERYVVYNPGSTDVQVAIAVFPLDGGPAPEPFVLDVPARRFASVDLDKETRVPPNQPHWVQVESLGAVGVAATRIVTITGSASSLGLQSGRAAGIGSPYGSVRSLVPYIPSGQGIRPALSIVNPDRERIAVVKLRSIAGGTEAELSGRPTIELAPGQGLVVDLSGAVANGPAGLILESNLAVVADLRVGGVRSDLSVSAAVPQRSATRELGSAFVSAPTSGAPVTTPPVSGAGGSSTVSGAPTTAPTTAAPTTAAPGG